MSKTIVYLSITYKNTIMGVSQNSFALQVGIAMLFIILNAYYLLILIPLIHKIIKIAYIKDEMFIEIYKKFSREVDYWDPWEHEK